MQLSEADGVNRTFNSTCFTEFHLHKPLSDALLSAYIFVRQRIAGPRAVALLSCSVMLPLLVGCGHIVRFPDLIAIEKIDDVAPLRNAVQHGLKNGLPSNADYLVKSSDLIELKSVDGKLVQPISDICEEPCDQCFEQEKLDADIYLAEQGRKVRVTAFVLNSVSALRIGDKQVCLGSVVGKSWSQLQANLKKLDMEPSILPQSTRWAMPADTVRVTVEYRFGLRVGAGIEPYTFSEMNTIVDEGGLAYVPALSSVTPEIGNAPAKAVITSAAKTAVAGSQYSALQVVAEQQAQLAARHIVFWFPGSPLAEQPTLDQLERCLKAVSSTQSLGNAFANCPKYGIDEYRYRPDETHNRQVNYKLTAEHKVTFVFWDGRRYSVPYRAGQTLADAARDIYHDVVGRDFSNNDKLFATVDPHIAIRAGGEQPFYSRLSAAQGAILDQVLLLPGDTVHLTRREPQGPR